MNLYYKLLKSLHNNNGSTLYNNKLVTGCFVKGQQEDYEGIVKVKVNNLTLTGGAVTDHDCFTDDCLYGSGIYQSAIPTDIQDPLSKLYFLKGLVDTNGNVWTVDFVSLCPSSSSYNYLERNIPLDVRGYANSSVIISSKLKIALIRKTSVDKSEIALTLYGDYPLSEQPFLTQPFCQGERNYTANNQVIDIEEISFTIISLILNNYHHVEDFELKFPIQGEVDKLFTSIIDDNYTRLYNLVDLDSTSNRFGSIPRYIASYSTNKNLYSSADERYNNSDINFHNDNCFDNGCFAVTDVSSLLVSRYVSTRAIAWLLYSLCLHKEYFNETKYDRLINYLSSYITSQIDKNYLVTEGWEHHNTLALSARIESHSLSTNVISCLALFKLFDLTSRAYYHELAIGIYQSIFDNFYSYKLNKFNSKNDSDLATVTYGMLFATAIKREDIIEVLLNNLSKSLVKTNYGNKLYEYDETYSSYEAIDYLNKDYLDSDNYNYLKSLSFINLNSVINTRDFFKELYLLRELIESNVNNGFSISSEVLNRNIELFDSYIENYFKCYSSFIIADKINFPLRNYVEELFSVNITYTDTSVFYRNFLTEKLKKWIPINFGWFSDNSLLPQSQLNKFLKSISLVIATFNVLKSRAFNADIYTLGYLELKLTARELSTDRLIQETTKRFIDYLISFYNEVDNSLTESGLKLQTRRYNYEICIEDKWNEIISTNGFYSRRFTPFIGLGYLSGEEMYSAGLIKVTVFRPLREVIDKVIHRFKPAGTKVVYEEVLTVSPDISIFSNSSCMLIKSISIPPECVVLLENGNYMLTELEEYVGLETCLPVEGCGILTELGELIISEIGVDLRLEDADCDSEIALIECGILTELGEYVLSEIENNLVQENSSCIFINQNSYIIQEDSNRINTEVNDFNLILE
jgi:hypothetical protein